MFLLHYNLSNVLVANQVGRSNPWASPTDLKRGERCTSQTQKDRQAARHLYSVCQKKRHKSLTNTCPEYLLLCHFKPPIFKLLGCLPGSIQHTYWDFFILYNIISGQAWFHFHYLPPVTAVEVVQLLDWIQGINLYDVFFNKNNIYDIWG